MNTVVYYPYIFPPLEWLKLASLCWDRVYTLIPARKQRSQFDPDLVQEFDCNIGGVLDAIDAGSIGSRREVIEEFSKWLESRAGELRSAVSLVAARFPATASARFSASARMSCPSRETTTRRMVTMSPAMRPTPERKKRRCNPLD